MRAREAKGAFTSFTDFLDKVPAVVCNKRTVESLDQGRARSTRSGTADARCCWSTSRPSTR